MLQIRIQIYVLWISETVDYVFSDSCRALIPISQSSFMLYVRAYVCTYVHMNKYVNSCSVYRNGEERYHGARILLNKRSHLDMEKVCSYSYTCMYVCPYLCTYVRMYVRMYMYIHRSRSICMITYLRMCTFNIYYVCMYVHISLVSFLKVDF